MKLIVGGLAAVAAAVPAQATTGYGYGTDNDNLYTTAACVDIATTRTELTSSPSAPPVGGLGDGFSHQPHGRRSKFNA